MSQEIHEAFLDMAGGFVGRRRGRGLRRLLRQKVNTLRDPSIHFPGRFGQHFTRSDSFRKMTARGMP
jgi:hypothetical protein